MKKRRGIVLEHNHKLSQPSLEWVYPITYHKDPTSSLPPHEVTDVEELVEDNFVRT